MYFLRNCQDKIPMNLLSKISEAKHNQTLKEHESLNLDLNYLIKIKTGNNDSNIKSDDKLRILQDSGDDFLVDISDEKMLEVEKTPDAESLNISSNTETKDKHGTDRKTNVTEKYRKCDIKLNDVLVKLENVKPSSFPPMTILDDKNGISVTLHLAKDKPKEGVNVYVITTVSKNELPLSNYLFQAVVPKVSIVTFVSMKNVSIWIIIA